MAPHTADSLFKGCEATFVLIQLCNYRYEKSKMSALNLKQLLFHAEVHCVPFAFSHGNQRASFMQLQFFIAHNKFFESPNPFENSQLRKLPHCPFQGEAPSLESSLFKEPRIVLLSWKIHYHLHKGSHNFSSYTDEYFT